MQIVSKEKGDRVFVISPTEILTIKTGSNDIDPVVAKKIDDYTKGIMKSMGMVITEPEAVKGVVVKTVETPNEAPVEEAPKKRAPRKRG